ncbi:hypothetical protein [Sciscionella sediminilitoris]|uniref:hypothetical protein n=1 Tax=Sciscionella sediminilitoris TaxID=1445613 RepID=UPI0004DEF2EB|nr:hypothetical protein [Sciscionella sp. SE31]
MTVWLMLLLALTLGAFAPAVWLGCTGGRGRRLLGLEFAGVALTLMILVWCQAWGQSSSMMLAFALVVLSFAGVLVFTRLLGGRT